MGTKKFEGQARDAIVYVIGLFDDEDNQFVHKDEVTGTESAIVFMSIPIPIGVDKRLFHA